MHCKNKKNWFSELYSNPLIILNKENSYMAFIADNDRNFILTGLKHLVWFNEQVTRYRCKNCG